MYDVSNLADNGDSLTPKGCAMEQVCNLCHEPKAEYCPDGVCRECHVSITFEDCCDGSWVKKVREEAGLVTDEPTELSKLGEFKREEGD